MAITQILALLVVTVAVKDLALGQVYNGYINPLFLPRGLRRGRLYDSTVGDPRDNGYILYREQDYNRYDDFRRYQSPYDNDRRYQRPFDSDRRYTSPYDNDQRYPNPYGSYRRFSNSNDGYQRYPVGLDGRFNDLFFEDNRVQYPAGVGLATTVAPLDIDRGQLLDRRVGFRERTPGLDRRVSLDGRGLGLVQGPGLGLDSGQGIELDREQNRGLERGRGFGLDRGQNLGLDRGQGLELNKGQGLGSFRGPGMNRGIIGLGSGQGLDREQIISTSSPEISVSVSPNSST